MAHKRKSYRAHIDPPELLVYRQLITQVHTARGSFWSHLLAAIGGPPKKILIVKIENLA